MPPRVSAGRSSASAAARDPGAPILRPWRPRRAAGHDYDWLVIGSGFGGSVSAMRLAEKGYRVGVVECGRRFGDDDFANSAWNLRRYFWLPRLGLRGIFRLTLFKDVFIVSGNGVGGGSLGYANTLYRARPAFFADPQWDGLADWEGELRPHYDTAERMLGVTEYEGMTPADELLREYAGQIGVAETFKPTRVGIFFGEPGKQVPDPYFGGEGPPRSGCIRCGSCMVGCRHGAKNTLVKNYLWFAERLGAEVLPERQAIEIRPLEAADGSDGYAVTTVRPGAWLRRRERTLTARGVVVAAGALGTNQLLADCKHSGALPRLSARLGHLVRTNSESIQAVTAPDDSRDFARSVAITSSIYPDPDTHIEVVTYGRAGDAMSRLFTTMTGPGTRVTRPLKWMAAMIRHPLQTARLLWPGKWSQRTVILLVMQSLDTAMRLRAQPQAAGAGRAPPDGAGSEAAQPHLPPRGRAGRPLVRGAHRRHSAERAHRVDPQHPHHRPHPRRRRDRRRPRQRRRGRPQPRLRLREPAGLRRGRGAGQPGRQPEPHDHRPRRAGDVLRAGARGRFAAARAA